LGTPGKKLRFGSVHRREAVLFDVRSQAWERELKRIVVEDDEKLIDILRFRASCRY